MDFNFTDEQTMLRESVQRYLAATYTFDARMAVVGGDAGWNPAVWQAFAAELGVLGAPFAAVKQSGIGRAECLAEMTSSTPEQNIHIQLRRERDG